MEKRIKDPPCPSCGSTRRTTATIDIDIVGENIETVEKTAKGIFCTECYHLTVTTDITIKRR